MADPQQRYQHLVARLRALGYRLTPQRLALLEILARRRDHPSAAQLYAELQARFPSASRATVYKTLALLREHGEVLELGFSDDDNRYDGNRPFPHPHLVCTRCRAIVDPDVPALQELPDEVARATGYRIVGHRLDLYGLCPDCRELVAGEEDSDAAG